MKKIEEVREYFINPRNVENVEVVAQLGADTIRAMALIYVTGGDISLMDEKTQNWLSRSKDSDAINEIMGELLFRESSTRKFDHKFMGQIHPSGGKIGILATLVAAYMNTNTIVKEVSSSEHRMEHEAIDWLGEMFGYDKEKFSGNIVTDGTLANLAALWVAREKKIKELKESGKWKSDTVMHVLVNDMRHYSIDKACVILGTGNVVLTLLPRKGYKTDLGEAQKAIWKINRRGEQVLALIGLAGETETGEVDNIDSLADLADSTGVFLHVDAAYGGPFIMSQRSGLFRGINRADSITVDPHKMLYVPYEAGAVLFKDKKDHALIQRSARYLQPEDNMGLLGDPEERNFGFAARVEGSMGSGGVMATWATEKLLGKEGFTALLDHTLELTNHCFDRVSGSKFLRPIHTPELNTLLIGLSNSIHLSKKDHLELVQDVQQAVDKEHGYYVSTNDEVDNGKAAFRFVATHPWTDIVDVDGLIDCLELEIASRI
jgi:glutamate/tyrosine decarboxylase-like PLP-dependent enzyme